MRRGGGFKFQTFLCFLFIFYIVFFFVAVVSSEFVLLLFPALTASLSLSLSLTIPLISRALLIIMTAGPARLLDNEAIFFCCRKMNFPPHLSCGLLRNTSVFCFVLFKKCVFSFFFLAYRRWRLASDLLFEIGGSLDSDPVPLH